MNTLNSFQQYRTTIENVLAMLSIACIFSSAQASDVSPLKTSPPNIIVILVDDLGYGDISSYGAKEISTPNIDQLAATGTRFTDSYATPVCTTSRAGLLTGRYPIRMGIHEVFHPESFTGMPPAEITIAEVLSDAGYATGIVGKWHLGHHPQFMPTQQGFHEFYGYAYSNDMLPYYAFDGEKIAEWEVDQSLITQTLTNKSIAFIDAHKNEPFFLYIAHVMPHIPIGATGNFKGKSKRGLYGDVVQELDSSIGTIMTRLDTHGLTENTIVMFSSDNGPWDWAGEHGGSSGPLRGAKRSTFEGGVRVPTIVSWPKRFPAGVVNTGITTLMDWFPTFVEVSGADTKGLNPIDGRSLAASLETGEDISLQNRSIVHYFKGEIGGYRSGDWKLKLPSIKPLPYIMRLFLPGKNEVVKEIELYNLRNDISEENNLVESHPEKIEQMKNELTDFVVELGPLPKALETGFTPLHVAPYYVRPLQTLMKTSAIALLVILTVTTFAAYSFGSRKKKSKLT